MNRQAAKSSIRCSIRSDLWVRWGNITKEWGIIVIVCGPWSISKETKPLAKGTATSEQEYRAFAWKNLEFEFWNVFGRELLAAKKSFLHELK